MPLWHTRRFAQVVTCLQEGLLGSKKMTKFVADRNAIAKGAAAASTIPVDKEAKQPLRSSTAEEKAIRAAAQNLMVVSTLVLDDDWNARLAKMVISTYSCWLDWHREQNRRLRATQEAIPWLQEQLQGGFTRTLAMMFRNCQDPKVH